MQSEWQIVFIISAIVYFIGAVFNFWLLDANIQPWAKIDDKNKDHIEIIEQEIQYLTDKIKSLEQQADSLTHLKNDSNANHRFSTTSLEIPSSHSREVVIAIEKKIQIIVRETRRIVDKLGETFDKKLSNKIEKKYGECGITKLK